MATLPNFNKTDPWELAAKFLTQDDQTIKNERYMRYQDKVRDEKSNEDVIDKENEPGQRYREGRAKGKANLENLQDMENAGLVADGNGRYRKSGANDPEVFNEFMEGVKEKGLTNPYGLAVVAGTGQVESGFSKANLHRKWSDPSTTGKAGTSGLLMSWRDDRLAKALQYGKERGEDMPSARTQGNFLADENPQMIEQLQNAGSLAEAQKIINNNWRFAGYDTGGGSTKARFDASSSYLKQFGANPMTAKERSTAGTQLATAPAANAPQTDETGRQFFEVQMDADGARKIQAGMPNARTNFVLDSTKPVGPKGQATYRQYIAGAKPVTPTAPAIVATPSIIPAPANVPPVVAAVPKARGYDGSEDEAL